jgi:hypothetical protein
MNELFGVQDLEVCFWNELAEELITFQTENDSVYKVKGKFTAVLN